MAVSRFRKRSQQKTSVKSLKEKSQEKVSGKSLKEKSQGKVSREVYQGSLYRRSSLNRVGSITSVQHYSDSNKNSNNYSMLTYKNHKNASPKLHIPSTVASKVFKWRAHPMQCIRSKNNSNKDSKTCPILVKIKPENNRIAAQKRT